MQDPDYGEDASRKAIVAFWRNTWGVHPFIDTSGLTEQHLEQLQHRHYMQMNYSPPYTISERGRGMGILNKIVTGIPFVLCVALFWLLVEFFKGFGRY